MANSDQPRYDELAVDDLADADLLGRFLSRRDEAAFAAIVRRHHGLVYGVCRRRLVCPHDAEDAFQATFLVLAQKGHKIASADSLASWLYGVAYRVSLRLARQRAAGAAAPLEEPVMVHDDPLVQLAQRHEQIVTDEELAALPERLRAPVVLRYLAGKSNEQVATELAISVAAVEGRLKRAKQKLRGRLVRRGIALSTTLASVGAAKWQTAHAAAPLITQTIATCLGGSSAVAAASGTAASASASAASTVPTSRMALQLAQKEVLAMPTLKLSNVAAIAAVIICTTTVGFGLRQAFSQSGDPFGAGGGGGGLVLDQGGETGGGAASGGSTDPFGAGFTAGGATDDAGNPFGSDVSGGAGSAGAPASGGGGTELTDAQRALLNRQFDMKGFTQTHEEIRAALEEPVNLQYIDIPLDEVMQDLSGRIGMHIELDRKALQDLGIDTSTFINAQYRGMSLRTALKLMLDNLELTYIVEDEYLLITTTDVAEQRLDIRIYPIRPQWAVSASDLATAITGTVGPLSWEINGGPGGIKPLGDNLVIHQTQEVHEEIVGVLKQLERATKYREDLGYGLIPPSDRRAGTQGASPFGGGLGGGLGSGFGGGAFGGGDAGEESTAPATDGASSGAAQGN